MPDCIPQSVDLLVVGGGINGAGIARDAAGRGLAVVLLEQDDLAAHTSSASSKLIHGGLRYLEQFQFRLVAEALAEREVLLNAAPHLVKPMMFVMPHVPALRPAWMIRTGLLLYDYLARRDRLPGSQAVDLQSSCYGAGLRSEYRRGFVYADCRVDDARLVLANARCAAARGAVILPRTRCTAARREGSGWSVCARRADGRTAQIRARALVNATGPWAKTFLQEQLGAAPAFGLKLVKGSHIAVPRLYEGDHAYILQNEDRRVVFVYSYDPGLTLIGTTDVDFAGDPSRCEASAGEIAYLCNAVNRYFVRQISPSDAVWSYGGIRPLFDDGSSDPSTVTRDYVLRVDSDDGRAPVISIFGGKITTYRRLAERALAALDSWFPGAGGPWTAQAPLPGGDLEGLDVGTFARDRLRARHPWLPEDLSIGLVGRHGAQAFAVVGEAGSADELGIHFGADLYAREVDYQMKYEWARTAEDVLWRRTKAGLVLDRAQCAALASYMAKYPVR